MGLTQKNLERAFVEFDLLKARKGIYFNTLENRRLGRVGQKYGYKHGEEKTLKSFDTRDTHSSDGVYSKYRLKKHREIRDSILKNSQSTEKPVVTLLMGGAASGKGTASTYFRDENAIEETTVLDVDKIKRKLPEYKDFDKEAAADNVHEESSELGKSIRKTIIDSKINFVNDATFADEKKAVQLIKDLRAQGYRIKLITVTIGIDEAKKREQARFERTGRRVRNSILESTHIGGSVAFETISGLVDEYVLVDNEVSFGKAPRIISSSKAGVVDQKAHQAFLDKKHYKRIA